MKLEDLLSYCPPGIQASKYVSAHVRGLYSQHLDYLATAGQKENPLQPDAVVWLNETKQLALDIREQGITVDPVVDGLVGRLAVLNVPREVAILRSQAKKSRPSISQDNRASVWREIGN